MRHQARVLIDATAGTRALVEIEGVSACQRCAKGHGCGAGLFNQGVQAVRLECFTSNAVHTDQTVYIEHDDGGSGWLWAVAGAYGLPTLGLLMASLLADWWLPSLVGSEQQMLSNSREWLTGLAALAGLAGGVIAWRSLAPFTLAQIETGPCLNSARIVAVADSSIPSSRESRNEA